MYTMCTMIVVCAAAGWRGGAEEKDINRANQQCAVQALDDFMRFSTPSLWCRRRYRGGDLLTSGAFEGERQHVARSCFWEITDQNEWRC